MEGKRPLNKSFRYKVKVLKGPKSYFKGIWIMEHNTGENGKGLIKGHGSDIRRQSNLIH